MLNFKQGKYRRDASGDLVEKALEVLAETFQDDDEWKVPKALF
ncbi:hypothetical protein FACS1894130_11820 [Spirochaetia bacterium]|nr:hypothetical protein FACS1894130_11820 [Spirochaetia bacterium]